MLARLSILISLLFSLASFSQITTRGKGLKTDQNLTRNIDSLKKSKPIKTASFDKYKIITLQKDTTFVDTSLTLAKDYKFNYIRKDLFGLLPFANEGQTYLVLDNSLNSYTSFPKIGFSGKHFNYLEVEDINYYSVATPVSDLYYKTVMARGQSVDALIALNTSERFNFSLAYRGLRSDGKYINQLTSNGNFRFTSSYFSKNKKYFINLHYVGQDLFNEENGGITTINDFENGNPEFKNRTRLEVYLNDASSFLKGKRAFINHDYKLIQSSSNNLKVTHQFNYEYKLFEYNQQTLASQVNGQSIKRFGDAYVTGGIKDKAHYNRTYNQLGLAFENITLGNFRFFAEDFQFNYYFDKVLILDSGVVPNKISNTINTIGGQYEYKKNKWDGHFVFSNSVSTTPMTNLDLQLHYKLNQKNALRFNYQNSNKIPDHIYNLHQSEFIAYNWYNDFKNEKINAMEVMAITQWLTASVQLNAFDDYLYFSNDTSPEQQLISPKQYTNTIKYLSVKLARDIQLGKFGLDNTILFQQVDQEDDILNVPQIVTRNTLYFNDYFFKKALYVQTGVTFNYFTQYYANDYNPVIAQSFIQNQKEIGGFPMFDFFINGRIRQTRLFLKAEHFNSSFSGNKYYTGPNYPYRDFTIRFGLVWNFFQ